ncbi:vacuolar ATP synthase subunit c, putative [Trypanosoma cruzi]|uniref:V-type proton ATPase subunit C n=1 Tax=Trypanosoma cruzi (strain CL Brener) TaxID=353153 RepID=Q4E5H0_TRYCC|nr:vacuolar ATP synthase subunit c, putative [Trypanosoma cruzi]EAO00040.1 vacuolar ATP synthase subunit c, putative [Trypanosoma cruzi]|eukprot:XP_821891.1 vacuolar ATP synthase subunit c [Trypanosoma cruzi strain CL Brener]
MTENFLIFGLPFLPQCNDTLPSSQFKCLVAEMGPLGQALRPFVVPTLKVGTLDSLIEASDELAKLDPQLENNVEKLIALMEETSQKPRSVVSALRINQTQEMTPAAYIKNFLWSSAQFDTREKIQSLIEKLSQISASIEERIRVLLSEYNETRNRLTAVNRKTQGNLSVKPIRELVASYNQKFQCFVDTEMLVTLFVVVPLASQKEWLETYWSLNEFVCPQSNRVIAEDKECVLNSIVTFRKAMDDVKMICRKKRFTVRDIDGVDDLSVAEVKELNQKAEKERKALYTVLWQQYSLCYVAWVHVKALRVFVESLLKYGLPPRCISVVLQVDGKKEAEIRKKILQIYPNLISPLTNEPPTDTGMLQYEYPYVSLKVTNFQKD